jgi:hypothetical protein
LEYAETSAFPERFGMINGNGQAATSKLVWWIIGVGGTLVLGGGAFFATSWLTDLKAQVVSNAQGRELRNERISAIEGRVNLLEQTGLQSLAAIKDSLAKMERWQEDVRKDIADLKLASALYSKGKP